MNRKQNAMINRKYKKVVTAEKYDYIDRLDRAYDLALKIRTKGSKAIYHHAVHLMEGRI